MDLENRPGWRRFRGIADFPQCAAQTAPLLRGVKTVQVDSTVVSNPEKVKEEAAANLVQDSLGNALRSANIELGPLRTAIPFPSDDPHIHR
jgi:hypothetical protein